MFHNVIIIDEHLHGLNPIQLGHEDCKPSHEYGPAVRTYWLLHYVVSGSGKFTREGKTHHIQAGQIFVIPPYIETYYQADAQNPWEYIWIGFTAEEIPVVFQSPVISTPNLHGIFKEMLSCKQMEKGRSAFLSGCLWKLVGMISDYAGDESDYIDKALNYMHSDYAEGITIQQIADSIGLNRKYFCHLFTKKVGVSPSQYLIRLRLDKAAELMITYRHTPTTAALSVGYDDIYHFSKIFKKHFGMSPREYCKAKLG